MRILKDGVIEWPAPGPRARWGLGFEPRLFDRRVIASSSISDKTRIKLTPKELISKRGISDTAFWSMKTPGAGEGRGHFFYGILVEPVGIFFFF